MVINNFVADNLVVINSLRKFNTIANGHMVAIDTCLVEGSTMVKATIKVETVGMVVNVNLTIVVIEDIEFIV